MIALAPCRTAESMNGTWAVAETALGPLKTTVSPSSFAAAFAPAPFGAAPAHVTLGIKKTLYPLCPRALPTPVATQPSRGDRDDAEEHRQSLPSHLCYLLSLTFGLDLTGPQPSGSPGVESRPDS